MAGPSRGSGLQAVSLTALLCAAACLAALPGASALQTCRGLPASVSTRKGAPTWPASCDGARPGVMCSAPCSGDYSGAFVSRCNDDGEWSAPIGRCLHAPGGNRPYAAAQQAVSTCGTNPTCYADPYKCRGPPTPSRPSANSSAWPTDRLTYSEGEMVTAPCLSGYVGGMFAVCRNGTWAGPYGTCWIDSHLCVGPPPVPTPANALDWPANLAPMKEGSVIWAECTQGWVGRVGAVCQSNGSWTAPFGYCARPAYECRGPPPVPPGANAQDWPQFQGGYAEGSIIQAACVLGMAGGVRSVCIRGLWTAPLGSCFRPPPSPLSCARRPTVPRPSSAAWVLDETCSSADGGFCRAACRAGGVGNIITFCRNGTWSPVSGGCNRPPRCRRQPSALPANSDGWLNCSRNQGGTCTATCRPPYVGGPSAICSNGTWGAAVGSCVFDSSTCTSVPNFFPGANTNGWLLTRCSSTEGGMCVAQCQPNFIGAAVAYCRNGRWTSGSAATVGATVGTGCYPAPTTCPRQPSLTPTYTEGWLDCSGITEGSTCYAECSPGFVGSPVSVCRGGRWSAVSGACWPDTTVCIGTPDLVPINSVGWMAASCSSVEGGVCVAPCAKGFWGRPASVCSMGRWGAVAGACAPLAPNASAGPACAAPPPFSTGDNATDFPASCAGAAAGGSCVAPCITGYVGQVWSVCNPNGSWTPPAGSCYRDCHVCDAPPALPLYNNDTVPWQLEVFYNDGRNIAASCKSGYVGSWQATCRLGAFEAKFGGCRPFDAAARTCWAGDLPAASAVGAVRWEFSCTTGPVADGKACSAVCAYGAVGSPTSFCRNGTWTAPVGSCRNDTRRCPLRSLPALSSLGAALWDYPCYWGNATYSSRVDFVEGEACTASCGDAVSGALVGKVSVTCWGGKWSQPSTTCLSRTSACRWSELPSLGDIGGAAWDSVACSSNGTSQWLAEGTACSATCASGRLGSLIVLCKAGRWSQALGSCSDSTALCSVDALPDPASFGASEWSSEGPCGTPGTLVNEGTACSASCAGATGTPTVRCRNGTWTAVEGGCRTPYPSMCITQPYLPDPGSFLAAGWRDDACNEEWSTVAEGGACVATCPGGQAGAPTVFCRNGTWSEPAGSCFAASAATCADLPTGGAPGPFALDWPANCSSAAAGFGCTAACADPYVGSYVAVCGADGTWGAPVGACFKSPAFCDTMPTMPPDNGLDWPLTYMDPYVDGSAVTTACEQGYVGGYQAECSGGAFLAPTGACWLDASFCRSSPPPLDTAANAQPWPQGSYVYPDGATIAATCLAGFVGAVRAICRAGQWTAPFGECWSNTRTCVGPPPTVGLNSLGWPTARASFAEGDVIEAPCMAGYIGAVRAQCLPGGTWSALADGCRRDPSVCFDPPAGRPGPNSLDWPSRGWWWKYRWDGDNVETGCESGFVGSQVAVCKLSTYLDAASACSS